MKTIKTEKAPAAIGPYSQAVVHENTVYVSGQIALDAETQKLVGSNAGEQAVQVLKNLGAILNAAGCSPASVVKTTIYLADMNDFAVVNDIYAEFFQDYRPARATVAVSGLPKGALVEIDAIAYLS